MRLTGPSSHVETYALLDEGSTISLIDEDIAERIGATGPQFTLALKVVGTPEAIESRSRRVALEISGPFRTHSLTNVHAVPNLALPAQTITARTITRYPHLTGLGVACYVDAVPTILVGQDNWPLIVTQEIRAVGKGAPAASRTLLGWALHGFYAAPTPQGSRQTNCLIRGETTSRDTGCPEQAVDLDLHDLVKSYFRIEALGVSTSDRINPEDERAAQILRTTSQHVGKSWVTGLLWRWEDRALPENKGNALERLRNLEKKLDRDPRHAALYYREMDRFVSEGYAEKIEGRKTGGSRVWYLPHFGVVNPNKPGRVRLVFDAAAKSRGVSLNDHLLAGPDLLNSLPGVLMRFRQRPIAVKGDIKDMFLRVKVREEDRDAQRFLWRGARREGAPDEYVMTSLIFGAKSSPCAALYIKDTNAKRFEDTMPEAVSAIINNCYMDDLLNCHDSEDSAIRTIRQITEINKEGGFEMHGWTSSSPKVREAVASTSAAPEKVELELCEPDRRNEKALGLRWDTHTDEIKFAEGSIGVTPAILSGAVRPTKREFLRVIMSIFDPLGFLAPFVIKSKILMQAVWISGIAWDDQLADDEFSSWRLWLEASRDIGQCSVPRHYLRGQEYSEVELHLFCDASAKAFATVAYWRYRLEDGSFQTSFIASKSRVAPLKPLSIPRLELQAAVMASRLATMIEREHELHVHRRVFWSDSRTVLLWIKSDPRLYQTFVSHRLGEIGDHTKASEWMWTPSGENPADDATRSNDSPLHDNRRWFQGPSFLRHDESEWPIQDALQPRERTGRDDIEKLRAFVAAIRRTTAQAIPEPGRFSSWQRLLRSTAWVLVAVDRWAKRKKTGLSLKHASGAEQMLCRSVQRDSFAKELEAVAGGSPINRGSRLSSLTQIQDKQGLLRVQGRASKLAGARVNNQPIILDGKHPITRLIIQDYHERANHYGDEMVVNELRQRYWITNLRAAVRSVISKCQAD